MKRGRIAGIVMLALGAAGVLYSGFILYVWIGFNLAVSGWGQPVYSTLALAIVLLIVSLALAVTGYRLRRKGL
ncbi:MAG TPA: hypothetical protein VEW71_05535 [Allosphingosinicella sp.]|nr:hypothetical protein [Allosphingosinicella sp.]